MSFKLPRELKKKMENLKDVVDWPSELRAFVEERVRELQELSKTLKVLGASLRNRPREKSTIYDSPYIVGLGYLDHCGRKAGGRGETFGKADNPTLILSEIL